MEEEKMYCPSCECEVQSDDDFCPDCGTLFADDVKCTTHEEEDAKGVCVICCQPFCGKCGDFIDDVFFCENDNGYKFAEGRANIFETDDRQQIDIVKDVLEEKGFHPLVISSRGGHYKSSVVGVNPDEIFPTGTANTLPVSYLMIPFQEVIKAEEALRELKLTE
jgi:hypothetical protein